MSATVAVGGAETGPSIEPPYWVVVFTARLAEGVDKVEYGRLSAQLGRLVRANEGFLGEDAASSEDGLLISVTYWRDISSLRSWAEDPRHMRAKELGRTRYFSTFELRFAQVTTDGLAAIDFDSSGVERR